MFYPLIDLTQGYRRLKLSSLDYGVSGKTAIITGAASGMGKATAILASTLGMNVVCVDVNDSSDTMKLIAKSGVSSKSYAFDITEEGNWESLVKEVVDEFGGIYLLANVAGVNPKGDTLLEQNVGGWSRIIDINLTGPWLSLKHVVPSMIDQGQGRIVNVSSVAALCGLNHLAAYTASKSGLAGITRQAAVEFGRNGITVNAIAPGVIDTPMNKDNPPEMTKEFLDSTPSGRSGTAEEIASLIMYLASQSAGYITGQTIAVDGGWSIQG
jgi:NAD(P)-dependent dehydrogenase (short-subunit alcohol dehydrogenase family)